MYSSTTSGRGSDSPNPFSTNASPPNSFDSRDPFETASSRQSNHPNYYRDGEYSEMGDTIPREPTLESEANLVGRNRADSYTTQGGGYDPYHGQFEFRLPARKNGSSAPLVALPNLGGRSNNANSPPNCFFFYHLGGHSGRGTDVESMGGGIYDRGTTPSAESLQDFHRRPDSQASLPTFDYASGSLGYEIYPAWVNARGCPISKE